MVWWRRFAVHNSLFWCPSHACVSLTHLSLLLSVLPLPQLLERDVLLGVSVVILPPFAPAVLAVSALVQAREAVVRLPPSATRRARAHGPDDGASPPRNNKTLFVSVSWRTTVGGGGGVVAQRDDPCDALHAALLLFSVSSSSSSSCSSLSSGVRACVCTSRFTRTTLLLSRPVREEVALALFP